MRICLATCAFFALFENGNTALAQGSPATTDGATTPACQHEGIVSYDPLVYDKPTKKCLWRRPENVRFLYLQGCGGGAGGQSQGDRKKFKDSGLGLPRFFPGVGGGAGELISVVIGPLSQDTYEISVGDIAMPDAGGNATSFSGSDANVLFQGGALGAGNGRRSAFAQGGVSAAGQIFGTDGDASLGAGGDGASFVVPNVKNATDGGRCAGGGGGIKQGPNKDLAAGNGGAGYLLVIPLVPFSGVPSGASTTLSAAQPPRAQK